MPDMSPRQVAHVLNIPERTVIGWIAKGWLPSQTATHGQRVRHRVSLDAARALMEERALEPRRPPTETRLADQLATLRAEHDRATEAHERAIAELRAAHEREIAELRGELPTLIRTYFAQSAELRTVIADAEDARARASALPRPTMPLLTERSSPTTPSYVSSVPSRPGRRATIPPGWVTLNHLCTQTGIAVSTAKLQIHAGQLACHYSAQPWYDGSARSNYVLDPDEQARFLRHFGVEEIDPDADVLSE